MRKAKYVPLLLLISVAAATLFPAILKTEPPIKLVFAETLSNLDEPTPYFYRDVAHLQSETYFSFSIIAYNNDVETLYFKVTGEAPQYTFATVDLGPIAQSKNSGYRLLSNFARRPRPNPSEFVGGEMEETIKLILMAYRDSNCTVLKWTYERNAKVKWINSSDPSFTVVLNDNFNDGQVNGWKSKQKGSSQEGTMQISSEKVLSVPYSAYKSTWPGYDGTYSYEFYKQVSVPSANKAYAVINVLVEGRSRDGRHTNPDYIYVHYGSTQLACVGPDVTESTWLRFVVPLTPGTTDILKITVTTHYTSSSGFGLACDNYLDDVLIVVK